MPRRRRASATRTAPRAAAAQQAPPPIAGGQAPSGGKPLGLDGRRGGEAHVTEREDTEEERDDDGGVVVIEKPGEEREGEQRAGIAGHPAPHRRASEEGPGSHP